MSDDATPPAPPRDESMLARIYRQRSSRGGGDFVLTRRRDQVSRRRTRAVRPARRQSATQSGRMDTTPQQKAGEKCGLVPVGKPLIQLWQSSQD